MKQNKPEPMNQASEQNRLELQIAIEQLQESIGQPNFGEKLTKTEELFRLLHLSESEKQPLQEQLNQLRQHHQRGRHDASAKLRQEVEERLGGIILSSDLEPHDWSARQLQLDQAKQILEDTRLWLEMEGRRLTNTDRDDCWQQLKARQQESRNIRQQFHTDALAAAEQILAQAREAVQNGPWRTVRETFKNCQSSLKALPLRGREREQFRQHFDQLWQELQARSLEHRQAAKQRQEVGLHKLSEALSKVQHFIARKEQELEAQKRQLEQADWFDFDRLKEAIARGEEALADAQRRQTEIQAKLTAANHSLKD